MNTIKTIELMLDALHVATTPLARDRKEVLSAIQASRALLEELKGQKPVAFDDWPEYHEHAMGCGLEDRGITDRYEAMRYGWEEALERAWEAIKLLGPLYTHPQPKREPLTDEQIIDLWPSLIMHQHTYAFARAIEAAHGINETIKWSDYESDGRIIKTYPEKDKT